MQLSENILSRRKALGLTQEQVAERLGVTPQAVYKWEKGLACPDVQMLAPLASLLETDMNALFAYATDPDEVELHALIESVSRSAVQTDGMEAAFAEARAALRRYPASAQLRLSLAIVLEGALLARGDAETEKQREIEEMYRFAAASDKTDVRDAARGILTRRLIQKGDLDAAEIMLDTLPDQPPQKWNYRAQLLKARGDLEAAAGLLESRLLGEASGLCAALSMLLDMAIERKDAAWAETLARTLEQTAELYSLWKGSAVSARLEIAIRRRDAGAAMAALEEVAAVMREPWTPWEQPLYRHAHFKKDGNLWLQSMPEILRSSVWTDAHYAFLRDDPRCAERLKEIFGAPDAEA